MQFKFEDFAKEIETNVYQKGFIVNNRSGTCMIDKCQTIFNLPYTSAEKLCQWYKEYRYTKVSITTLQNKNDIKAIIKHVENITDNWIIFDDYEKKKYLVVSDERSMEVNSILEAAAVKKMLMKFNFPVKIYQEI